jgi:proteasome inhibitor subunit 1 (PI31)
MPSNLYLKHRAALAPVLSAGSSSAAAAGRSAQQKQETASTSEGQQGPRRRDEGEDDDPLRDPRFPGYRGGAGGGGGMYGGVGARDVVPPGMRPPGFAPAMPNVFDPLSGGGMHVGPRDPMFIGGGGIRGGGGVGIGGGGGPPAFPLPPGARYDPINPPGLPGFRPDDFIPGGGRGRGGRGAGPGPGPGGQYIHPDVMQPGRNDDDPGWDQMYG